jgi:hypothetical protein
MIRYRPLTKAVVLVATRTRGRFRRLVRLPKSEGNLALGMEWIRMKVRYS